MQKIMLTGGNGFIGRNFVESYKDLYEITAPTRSELDLTDLQQVEHFFEQRSFDCIIHSAAIGVSNEVKYEPFTTLHSNLRAFDNVFSKRHVAKRFINLGSGAAYGRPLLHRQIKETNLGMNIPKDEYGLAKMLSTKVTRTESTAHVVTLHLFGVYGPYEDYRRRFISNAIVRSMFDLPITINQDIEFDYVYIKDFLKIITCFVECPAAYSDYNITTGKPIRLLEIAELVSEITGNKNGIIVNNTGRGNHYTGSNDRLKSFLPSDFKFTPLKQAIEELVAWYELNIHSINKRLVE